MVISELNWKFVFWLRPAKRFSQGKSLLPKGVNRQFFVGLVYSLHDHRVY